MGAESDKENDSSVNEKLADRIEKEWLFHLRRLPTTLVRRLGAVQLIIVFLQLLLITSNFVGGLGYWNAFITKSTNYRDEFNRAIFDRTDGKVDFTKINSYSLWRGFVVPSIVGCVAYVGTAVVCLRHELYQWKPEILKHYGRAIQRSRFGSLIPQSWLKAFFTVYKEKHEKRETSRIQRDKEHASLTDITEFRKMLHQVALNLVVSFVAIFAMWMAFLQTKIEARHIVRLPRSYVPPIQGIVWYIINDMLYYYPHRMAHSAGRVASAKPPSSISGLWPIMQRLSKALKQSHRLHHRCKANIGIAAWYCSVWEQLLFNLFPALVGPVLTQIAADAAGVQEIWGTHLVTLYIWIAAAAANSVLAHTGYRSIWHDPGEHDLHHERAFDPKRACNFGTAGIFDRLHGTKSKVAAKETRAWRRQQDRQVALYEAARRSGIPLTDEQASLVKQPIHGDAWMHDDDENW